MAEAGEGSAPQWFSHPASLLAALYPHTPGARPSLCPTPTPKPSHAPVPAVAHNTQRYAHPLAGGLALSGRPVTVFARPVLGCRVSCVQICGFVASLIHKTIAPEPKHSSRCIFMHHH